MSYVTRHSSIPPIENFDENRWIIHIRRTLEEELADEEEFPVCIFHVPKILMSCKEQFYEPQIVAIGPYHHWRQEIFEMEWYKLAAAKRTQKRMTIFKFKSLVKQLSELEQRIRGFYHTYLDYNGETFTWMITLDLSFLLEILEAQVYPAKEGRRLNNISSGMSHLVDYSGRKSAHNAILRDIIMLENQVPLFLLRKYLEVEYGSMEEADKVLSSMLAGLCKKLAPCNTPKLQLIDMSEASHVLDFLYKCIIPNNKLAPEPVIPVMGGEDKPSKKHEGSGTRGYLRRKLGKLTNGPVQKKLEKVLNSILPTVTSRIPGFVTLSQILKTLFFQGNEEDEKPDEQENEHHPPSVEQIMIPSVTDLYNSGVRFLPSYGDIQSTSFNSKTGVLMLPRIFLDGNTEVVLRNLVVYEASMAEGPLIFTRYTEFMNGIIDTEEDVKLLREKRIILNHLNSDREVADLWNGMSKSIRLTKVPSLDKVIEDVNTYYSAKWRIKVVKYARVYVFGSWKFLTVIATVLLLLMMGLQAFCSVCSCAKTFHVIPSMASLVTPPD